MRERRQKRRCSGCSLHFLLAFSDDLALLVWARFDCWLLRCLAGWLDGWLIPLFAWLGLEWHGVA